MILWVDGVHDPTENMRRDVRLLLAAEQGAPPVLRLFQFEPFGITLGRAQRPEAELDRERCEADGIPWAVRPTGGRAIFHAEEWTYSLATPIDDPQWGGSASESYDRLSATIACSLRRLGIPAELHPGRLRRPGASEARRVVPGTGACFAATARHEIVLSGRKLVGSAQRRTRTALLQQGSVLLGSGHLRWADYAALPEVERASVREMLALVTAHAGSWLEKDRPLGLWADSLAAELPRETLRLEREEGRYLLTLDETGSYTPLGFAS